MDRELSKQEKSKGQINKWMYPLLGIALLIVAIWGLRSVLAKKGKSSDFHIVSIERGDISNTLSASGTVIASSERVINAPVTTEISEVFLSTGTQVGKDELILKLDQEYTRLSYDQLKDELALRKNNIEKLKLQYDKDLKDLDYRDQIKGLQLSELKTQVSDKERLFKVGGATQEEVEASKLQLNIAELEKKMLENELAYKRSVNKNEKKNLELEYDIQYKRLAELQRKLDETLVKATEDGVITWINEDIGKTVNEGEPLVRIANLNKFKVEASTSDRNSKSLDVGMPVQVRIGKVRLNGTIDRILPEIINNTVRFFIVLEESSHEVLRPNMRTEVYIITDSKTDVLRSKRGNALKGTSSQYFYKVVGNEAIKTRVTKGLISQEHFEILEGLVEGDRIIISDVSDYDHMDSFEILED